MKLSLLTLAILCYLGPIFQSCVTQQDKLKVDQQSTVSGDREQYLEWFKESKFGMFVHWGPYSQLAGEWNGQQVPLGRGAEWIMEILKIPVDEYRELARSFNPVKFDAREWVMLAKATGMKYIVITAKHHDGFAMYHSQVSPYNIVDWTPFKRDPLKELADECAREGIKFCVYYSHREDWDHPGGYGNDWEYDNDWGTDLFDPVKFPKYLDEKAKPQLKELLENYGPLGLVWFDRGLYTPEQGQEFVDLIHSIQPSTLINGRVGHYFQELLGDYQDMNDKGIPPGGLGEYFQTPQTLNETWGYSKFDTGWKSPETVVRQLVQVVSRGGNYLLNIGPKGDGSIPEANIGIFREVGEWMDKNAESIYGTTANPFGELDWGYCTVKGNKLYLFIREWPKNNTITLSGLKNPVSSAYMLSNKSATINVIKTDNTAWFALPQSAPDDLMPVIVVELSGTPDISPTVVHPTASGKIEMNYLTVKTLGETVTRFNRKGGFHISKWNKPADAAEWLFKIDKPGKFRINIDYAANMEWEGKLFEVTIDKYRFERPVIHTGGWFEYRDFPINNIEFSEPGEYKLTIRPKTSSDHYLMYLRSVSLSPVDVMKKEGWGLPD